MKEQKELLNSKVIILTQSRNDIQGIHYFKLDALDKSQIEVKYNKELLSALGQSTRAHERVKAWHEKMITSQQALLKSKKDLERSKALATEYKTESILCNSRLDQLDEYINTMEVEMDSQRMDWEKQQEEFDAILSQYETERDQIYNAAVSVEVISHLI